MHLDPATHSEQDQLAHREALFTQVKENLERIGLRTVKDLKNSFIFSRKALESYIAKHLD